MVPGRPRPPRAAGGAADRTGAGAGTQRAWGGLCPAGACQRGARQQPTSSGSRSGRSGGSRKTRLGARQGIGQAAAGRAAHQPCAVAGKWHAGSQAGARGRGSGLREIGRATGNGGTARGPAKALCFVPCPNILTRFLSSCLACRHMRSSRLQQAPPRQLERCMPPALPQWERLRGWQLLPPRRRWCWERWRLSCSRGLPAARHPAAVAAAAAACCRPCWVPLMRQQ